MLIVEDLLLVATDPESGAARIDSAHLEPALGGAVLLDLLLAHKIALDGEGRRSRVTVVDPVAMGDPLLDPALETLASRRELKPQDAVTRIAKKLRPRIYARLAARGLVTQRRSKVLGLFPTTRWPARDASHRRSLDDALRGTLVLGQRPDERTATLVSLLHAAGAVKVVVDKPDRKLAKQRAESIGDGDWASEAVRRAIRSAHDAASAAIVASTVAAGAAGASSS